MRKEIIIQGINYELWFDVELNMWRIRGNNSLTDSHTIDLEIDLANLGGNKSKRLHINVKQLLLLNNTDIDEQLRKYGDIPYEEFLGVKDMPVKEQVKGLKEHYCLGELYMYAKLVETVLYKYVFESKESWVTLAEKNGNQLYQAKINGLNI
jgi:hypothetical protein